MRQSVSSWKLGKIAGIDLFLHPTFIIVPLMILWQNQGLRGLIFTMLIFGFVVLHELGHALMARRYGIATQNITLYPIGGVARLERMPRSAGPELLIALAGPAVNLAIAAITWPLLWGLEHLTTWEPLLELFEFGLWVNVGLLLFNLLPVFPMDGGRVLRALLTGWVGRLRATEIAARLGGFIAMIAGIYFLFHGMIIEMFLSLFIYVVGTYELWSVRAEQSRKLQAEGWPEPPVGYRWVDRGDGVWRLVRAGFSRTWKMGRP